MTPATVTEPDIDDIETGKQRCRVRRRADADAAEPGDAKGRDDAGVPRNGVIKC